MYILSKPKHIWFAVGLITALGIALIVYGWLLPVYSNASAARLLMIDPYMGSKECAPSYWYDAMTALRTGRYGLINTGCALLSTGIIISAIYLRLHAKRLDGHALWRTPSRSGYLFALGVFVLCAFGFSLFLSFHIDLTRSYFPSCSDSIGIPLAGILGVISTSIVVCMMIGFVLSRFFGNLPVNLSHWDRYRPIRSWVVTVGCSILVGAFVCIGAMQAPTSNFLNTGLAILVIYILLSSRAALLAPTSSA